MISMIFQIPKTLQPTILNGSFLWALYLHPKIRELYEQPRRAEIKNNQCSTLKNFANTNIPTEKKIVAESLEHSHLIPPL